MEAKINVKNVLILRIKIEKKTKKKHIINYKQE